MNAITAWMERYFVPLAAKIGAQKHLVALRDAFIGTMPATMAGAIAVMINAIVRDLPAKFFPGYDGSTVPVVKEIISVNGFVWNGTLAIVGIIFAFSWGYNLAKAYKVNELAGGIVSLAALIQGVGFSFSSTTAVKLSAAAAKAINGTTATSGMSYADGTLSAGGWGWLKLGFLDGNAYFVIMVMGALATIIYAKLMLKEITIKMPDTVPPAVAKAFTAIIPAAVALYVTAIIYYLFSITLGKNGDVMITWVQKTIAEPFMHIGQSLGAILLVTFLVSLMWLFGLHGSNVMAPVLEGIWGVGLLKNSNVYQAGGMKAVKKAIEAGNGDAYMWVRNSFDSYAWFGGVGGTITLLIMILALSKREDYRVVAKLGIGPSVFNINEPVMFGLPIVLNPIFFIPFILAPLAGVTIGYAATAWHLVDPIVTTVPWVVPPFLMSLMATAYDWRAPIVTLVSFIAALAIWAPFVIAANGTKDAD
ncbi:MAG: PTS transporter subunit EIIC [Lactococcus sp.]|uniref:PTS sugar transporter subunit IIC n=1 Tax=Pseudolactococcus carnosus TaxID=2749961 RepID=UPI001FBBDF01|nr:MULTISPECIES: PTS transporter subunit EIIC [Lactococcus]MCJ1996130.1 PTS sugar transporter subunit IIC [Lactococcus carnosus]MDN5402733.1 PTS transporter subunit EIIC [Lactococcus sp.]MDN5408907.1 PTS transporter subunit EIIC [Lactococcus sp.]MDN5411096.1 PTS transporter subunit EIIC [Lactococcus sp.]MDN5435648.1 PTS transporter subunit EIIC [Lactococcus sp.]